VRKHIQFGEVCEVPQLFRDGASGQIIYLAAPSKNIKIRSIVVTSHVDHF
jgi:hypothetical protein